MARQYMKVVGVGGGRAGRAPRPVPRTILKTPRAPIVARFKDGNRQA